MDNNGNEIIIRTDLVVKVGEKEKEKGPKPCKGNALVMQY